MKNKRERLDQLIEEARHKHFETESLQVTREALEADIDEMLSNSVFTVQPLEEGPEES